MISRRTAACQYGSREEFAIIEARHDTPMETSSPAGVVSPLWQAPHSWDVANMVPGCPAGNLTAGLATCGLAASGSVKNSAPNHNAITAGSSARGLRLPLRILIATRPAVRRRTSPTGNT